MKKIRAWAIDEEILKALYNVQKLILLFTSISKIKNRNNRLLPIWERKLKMHDFQPFDILTLKIQLFPLKNNYFPLFN